MINDPLYSVPLYRILNFKFWLEIVLVKLRSKLVSQSFKIFVVSQLFLHVVLSSIKESHGHRASFCQVSAAGVSLSVFDLSLMCQFLADG